MKEVPKKTEPSRTEQNIQSELQSAQPPSVHPSVLPSVLPWRKSQWKPLERFYVILINASVV